ncbi:hypothetical protein BMWSH_4715 [Priestia megaterium WSH-002]|uniref:Uncharacterized protein n=1 Tax=Priestia megaterium (strain WSH-002) TaxID=1006007 RepID=A0A8D4BRK5_PRIMW|nr:hypothetical protein BMWSH_4715 [Priestia megaterium WSH-002]
MLIYQVFQTDFSVLHSFCYKQSFCNKNVTKEAEYFYDTEK